MMARFISRAILKALGWKVELNYDPAAIKKYVVVVIPHTSNWDFPLGILSRSAIGADVKFIGKKSLFRFPFGLLFRRLGGYPVDRSKKSNLVDAVVDIFNSKETFAISIAPEGTRKKVNKLKTGFYYIAKGAKIPLILCQFDYGRKKVAFGEPFYVSEDKNADFKYIMDYFRDVRGKNPELGIFSNLPLNFFVALLCCC